MAGRTRAEDRVDASTLLLADPPSWTPRAVHRDAATGSVTRYSNVVDTAAERDIVRSTRFDVTAADLRAADARETSACERRVVTLAGGTSARIYIATGPVARHVAMADSEN